MAASVLPVTEPGEEFAVEVVWASREGLSRCACQDGRSTGVRKTMMQTTAARHAPATPSSLPLCSMAPRRTARKKPLSKKNKAMLTELFTPPAYQKPPRADSEGPVIGPARPGRDSSHPECYILVSKHGASAVRLRANLEPRGKPVRSRHGPATVTGPAQRAWSWESDTCCRRGADALRGESDSALTRTGRRPVRPSWSGRGVADLLSTILRAMTIELNREESA